MEVCLTITCLMLYVSVLQGGGLLIEEIFVEGNAHLDGRLIEGEKCAVV